MNNENCKCKLYADDVKLYTTLDAGNTNYDILQDRLNVIGEWAIQWQLSISYAKCNVVTVSRRHDICANRFVIDGHEIINTDSVRDLGVHISSELSFSTHIRKVVSKAFVRANLILKCFLSRDRVNLIRAFITYVRPLLEYATCCWSPHHIADIKLVESVQRKFTKKIPGLKAKPYHDRLAILGIESLELKRLRSDLIYAYKILFGYTDTDLRQCFTFANNFHGTRGHAYKLLPSYNRLDLRKYFFVERVIQPWNYLPAERAHFSNVNVFKRFVSKVDLSKFLTVVN